MSFNSKIFNFIAISIVLLIMLMVLNYFYLKIEIIDSFCISFISGAIVSLFATYMQYREERTDIIRYCNSEVIKYYQQLNNILLELKRDNISFNDKIYLANTHLRNYLANNSYRDYNINFNYIFKSIDDIAVKAGFTRLFNYSNGLELMKKMTKPKEEDLNKIIELCEKQLKEINEDMIILTQVFNVDYHWREVKEYIDVTNTLYNTISK